MSYLEDGLGTIITFSADTSVLMEELAVKPPGLEGGGKINTTTLRNLVYRTFAPKRLREVTDVEATVVYSAAVWPEIQALLKVNQQITITYPDGATLVVWGWLETTTPGSNTEGEQPEMDIVVCVSNRDTSRAIVAPVFTAAP